MTRRALIALLLLVPAPLAAQQLLPEPATPAERQRQLDAWWARQREKEAADRFRNGPREARRKLTQDQIERWEYERDPRRNGWRGTRW